MHVNRKRKVTLSGPHFGGRRGGMAVIEAGGRVCGSSGGSLGPGSAERFVANCIRGGMAVIEAVGRVCEGVEGER